MYLKATGLCEKCGSHIWLSEVMDSLGNIVASLNCWNGHYEALEIIDSVYGEISDGDFGVDQAVSAGSAGNALAVKRPKKTRVSVSRAKKVLPRIAFMKADGTRNRN